MSEFRLGDKVSGHGLIGEVIRFIDDDTYPITVNWESGDVARYTKDGRYLTWHKEPAIKLLSRKVKVKREMWINIYPDGVGYGYPFESVANGQSRQGRISCQKFQYEIEVDEVCE